MSNHPNFDNAMALSKRVGTNLKTLRTNMQDLLRSLTVAIAIEGFDKKTTLDTAKINMGYDNIGDDSEGKAEKATIRKQLSRVSLVVDNWPHFSNAQRNALVTGEGSTAPFKDCEHAVDIGSSPQVSTVASNIAKHDKIVDEARKKAAEPTPPTDEELDSQDLGEFDSRNEGQSPIMAVVDMLTSDQAFTTEQQAELALLFDAVDAYRESAIEQAIAA